MAINKEQTCVLIGAHPQNSNDSALLSLTIEGIKRQGFKVCLVSHSPVNVDIQKSVNYYVYSDENELLNFPNYSNSIIYSNYNNYYYQSNLNNTLGTTHYASLINLKNGLSLLNSKGFTHFVYHNYDYFLNQKDHELLENYLENLNTLDYWFMNENHNQNKLFPVLSIFAGKISYFINLFDIAKSPQSYLDNCNNNYIMEFFVKKRLNDCVGFGKIENFKPSDVFTSKWTGIGDSKGIHLPDYDNISPNVDLVRDFDNENHIYGILPICKSNKDVLVKLYKNNNIISSGSVKLGSMYWWWYKTTDNDLWKIECWLNNKLVSLSEKKGVDILNNRPSFLKFNKS
jgi:hypothetical protein